MVGWRPAFKNSGDLAWPSLRKFRVEKLGRGDLGVGRGVLDAVGDHDGASDYGESAADLAHAEHVLGDERDR